MRALRTHPENEAETQARDDAMRGAEEQFFATVQTYLEQAVGHIHGAGTKEDIPEVLLHLKLLVHVLLVCLPHLNQILTSSLLTFPLLHTTVWLK
jgi:hypothetical protein